MITRDQVCEVLDALCDTGRQRELEEAGPELFDSIVNSVCHQLLKTYEITEDLF